MVIPLMTLLMVPLSVNALVKLRSATRSFALRLSSATNANKKRLVYLGTPDVAASCLETIYNASKNQDSFDIVAVVSQPPSKSGRKKTLINSPVHQQADKLGIPVLVPETAKDPEFLQTLENLNIDLCITAAYGNFLPKKFLSIPKYGTVNIHPSLLPKYRGAAPVQRCLENGDELTGVSVVFTVLKMDAGPIIEQISYPLDKNAKSPDILEKSFQIGAKMLLQNLPSIFDGTIRTTEQNEEEATSAPKLNPNSGLIDFSSDSATIVHNKCRGFSDWPGTSSYFLVGSQATESTKIKIITTVVVDPTPSKERSAEVVLVKHEGKDVLQVVCADGSKLGIVEIQPLSKKIMPAKAFLNGLRGDLAIKWVSPPSS